MSTVNLLPVINAIHRTIREARDAGHDYRGQSRQAVLAVVAMLPDLPPHEALFLVQRVRNDAPLVVSRGMASRMFYPFATSKIGGTGMGLAISRSLIEANGGRLWHKRHDGPGATFCCTLPLVD